MNSETALGTYIYMGMGMISGHTVCMSVAYKLDYSVKKALQFEKVLCDVIGLKSVYFLKVNKVKVGQLEAETSFTREELEEYVKRFS
jgi:hypothetical protein